MLTSQSWHRLAVTYFSSPLTSVPAALSISMLFPTVTFSPLPALPS